jgi:hypothetical protein
MTKQAGTKFRRSADAAETAALTPLKFVCYNLTLRLQKRVKPVTASLPRDLLILLSAVTVV